MIEKEVLKLGERWSLNLLYNQSSSKATLKAYKSDFLSFLDFFQNYLGEDITLQKIINLKPQDWRAWLTHQRNKKIHTKTMCRKLSALKSFFKFLVKEEYIQDHIIFSMRPPKVTQNLPRPILYEDIQLLIEKCSSLSSLPWIHKRDEALIFLLYSIGLRISEALNLNIEDFKNKKFITIQGKRNKKRQLPLMPMILQKIEDYKKSCPYSFSEKGPLFLGQKGSRLQSQVFEKRIRQLRRLLDFSETLTPHAFRHSCASHLMSHSEDLRSIQELLGHTSLSTTQIYTHINNEHLKTIYQKAHPSLRRKNQTKTSCS